MLLPRIFNNGFGLVSVIGVNLVPSPAHKMIARMKFEVELCFVESKFAESGVDFVKVAELFAESNFAESALLFRESNLFADSNSVKVAESNFAESAVDSAESALFPPPNFKI